MAIREEILWDRPLPKYLPISKSFGDYYYAETPITQHVPLLRVTDEDR